MSTNEFIKVRFRRVPKLEFRTMVNNLIKIVSRYDPVSLHIDPIFQRLVTKAEAIKRLQIVVKKHPKRNEIIVLRTKRNELFRAIVQHTKALVKAAFESQSEQLKIIYPFIDKHFICINSNSSVTKSSIIHMMQRELDNNSVMNDAAQSLGLQIYFDTFKNLQKEIDNTEAEQISLRSKKPKMITEEVKIEVSLELQNLLNAIQLARLQYPDLDYSMLISHMNQELISNRSQMRGLLTRSKNAKLKKSKIEMEVSVMNESN